MAVLAPGFSSRVLGVISATSRSHVWFFVPYPCLLVIYYTFTTWKNQLFMMFLLRHQFVSWAQVLPHLFFSYLQLCYKFTFHNFFILLYVTVVLQSSGTLCVISDGILLNGYINMWVHIIPEAEKANTSVMDALATPLSSSYIFPLCVLKLFQALIKIRTWIITVENSCCVQKNVQRFFFFQDIFNLLKLIPEK